MKVVQGERAAVPRHQPVGRRQLVGQRALVKGGQALPGPTATATTAPGHTARRPKASPTAVEAHLGLEQVAGKTHRALVLVLGQQDRARRSAHLAGGGVVVVVGAAAAVAVGRGQSVGRTGRTLPMALDSSATSIRSAHP